MSEQGLLANFIAGEFRPALAGESLENIDPATNACLSLMARSRAADVNAAVAAAKTAFHGEWGTWTRLQRADMLDAIATGIEARHEELAGLESRDTGKPVSLARKVDIPRAAANFRFFAGALRHDETACHTMDGAINYTLRKALGPIALITPWNLPLYLLTWKIAPALAMGNTIVAKPSEMTPSTATKLMEIMHEVGLPKGVCNLVHGLGAEAGQALIEHPDVKAVSFTGGTVTGRRVAATAAPLFKKLSLELGGKNPTVVFADADFEESVEGAVRAGFLNQGQVCLCGSRVFIERGLFDAFSAAFVERVKAMKVGDPSDPETTMGALISRAHRDKVESYIALAKEEGGQVLCGGERPKFDGALAKGAFLQPTVITGLSPDCRTATEEIFGPVVTLHAFDTEQQALRLANGVPFGLAASVWTSDLKRAHRFSAALDTGMVWVNTWLLRDLRVPFGGMKDSGVGREGGRYSLEFFSEARNICIKL